MKIKFQDCIFSTAFILFFTPSIFSQGTGVNANVKANRYDGYFLYGSNMGWLNSSWSDEDIADILIGNEQKNREGVGVNSLRPALYDRLVEEWGYDVRLSAFKHYQTLGAEINTIFLNGPSSKHKDKKEYCPGKQPESFANLYEPIWDNGENGTPVNENNYYATYVYQVVKRYGGQTKFWEVWNEPDYTHTPNGDKKPGESGNWWDQDPPPCELSNLYTPIQSYVRMLRITYEVVKSIDPKAFVCVGGIGYDSFFDAVLRNTDNPDGGKITNEYPYKGGAWFDCLSYHIYPMYYLRRWSDGGFKYSRHSDAAVDAVVNRNAALVGLLKKYGYDGTTYPEKEIIITETNIPSKQVGDYIGSEQAQRNFLMKAAIMGQKNGISAIYPYSPWDGSEVEANGGEYNYTGFYKPLPASPQGGTLRMKESGIGWRTVSRMLKERKFDSRETFALELPEGIEGGAFYSSVSKDYVYALWPGLIKTGVKRRRQLIISRHQRVFGK